MFEEPSRRRRPLEVRGLLHNKFRHTGSATGSNEQTEEAAEVTSDGHSAHSGRTCSHGSNVGGIGLSDVGRYARPCR